MPTKGLFKTEPFMYVDPETQQTRHIIEVLFGKATYLFAGNANRPIVHVLTNGEFTPNPLALETYRKFKVSEGWGADIVEKTISRISKPPKYTIVDNDGAKLLTVFDNGNGLSANTWNSWFGPGWEQSNKNISDLLCCVLLGYLGSKPTTGFSSDLAPMLIERTYKGTSAKGWQISEDYFGKSDCAWLVPVPAVNDNGWVPQDDDGQTGFLSVNSMWINNLGESGPGCWKITDKAPKAFRGLRIQAQTGWDATMKATYAAAGSKLPLPCSVVAKVNADQLKDFVASELEIKESLVEGDILFGAFSVWVKQLTVNPGPTGATLPGGLSGRGFFITMPNGMERYRMQFDDAKAGTVLGVDGVVVKRLWEEMVMTFPALADSIEFQLKGDGTPAQKAKMEESMNSLREQPEGRVNLVQYAAMQPLPYNPLEFLGLQKFAKRAETTVDDEKMAEEGKHVVTWGEANKRVNLLGESDYFVTINDPETVRLGFDVRPFVGTAATHVLYFSQSATGIRCRLALKGGSVVGGESDLDIDEALNYSQLGYEFTYDLGLAALQDPKAEVRAKFFGGVSEADLVVADPESGDALKPDLALSQSLDVSRLYDGGSLFFPKLAQVDQPVAALMNKGIDQPEQLRALLQQASVAAFGAFVSDASRYPSLD